MGSRERERQEAIYGHLYKKVYPVDYENTFKCICCGTPYELTKDHVPPLSTAQYFVNSPDKVDFLLFTMCQTCNSLASDFPHTDINERIAYIKEKLYKKRSKDISAYKGWDKKEVKELGRNLRGKVMAAMKRGQDAFEAMEFEGYDYYVDSPSNPIEINPQFKSIAKSVTVNGKRYPSIIDAIKMEANKAGVSVARVKTIVSDTGVSIESAISSLSPKVDRSYAEDLCRKVNNFDILDRPVNSALFVESILSNDQYRSASADIKLNMVKNAVYTTYRWLGYQLSDDEISRIKSVL